MRVTADVKEALLEELRAQAREAGIEVEAGHAVRVARDAGGVLQVHRASGSPIRARRVLIAIGRSGDFRRLGVPGESRDKVTNRLHDPKDFAGKDVLVVGEAATRRWRRPARRGGRARHACLPRSRAARLKPANAERLAASRVRVLLRTRVREIGAADALLRHEAGARSACPTAVFPMIGRDLPGLLPPLADRDRRRARRGFLDPLGLFLVFCAWLYNWKSGGSMARSSSRADSSLLAPALSRGRGLVARDAADPRTLIGTLAISAAVPFVLYTLAYTLAVAIFGIRRIVRREDPLHHRADRRADGDPDRPPLPLPEIFRSSDTTGSSRPASRTRSSLRRLRPAGSTGAPTGSSSRGRSTSTTSSRTSRSAGGSRSAPCRPWC